MFTDTAFNSITTVMSNIYQNMLESAIKYCGYAKCLPRTKQPRARILIGQCWWHTKRALKLSIGR